ncbi:MAG: type II secretion system protein GspN [Myxococcota bacterium]|nr:type II secretion system protein GspN [Myxococcota bacterium]
MLVRMAKFMAGSLWFFVCILLGVKLFFPAQAAADRVSFEVDRATKGSVQLVLGDVAAWTLSGLAVDELQVLRQPRARGRRNDEEASPKVLAELDTLQVRLNLLPLLGGSQLLGLAAELYDGSLSGTLGRDGKRMVLDLMANELDLSQYPAVLPDGEALQLVGRLSLESDLRIDSEELEDSSGDLVLEIDGFGILNEAFADSFSEAVVELEADDGKLIVSKGNFEGEKIQAVVTGEIVLKERMARSRVDIKIRVKMDTSYELLANAAGFKRARDSDGYYHFKCTGTLDNRRCRKDTAAARGSGPRGGRGRSGDRERSSSSSSERFSPDETAEERRERRQERIRERRKKARERRSGAGSERERVRPDPSRSRRGRDDDRDEDDEEDFEEEMFEDEPPFEDDVPLPDLRDADMDDYDDDMVEEISDEPYIGD